MRWTYFNILEKIWNRLPTWVVSQLTRQKGRSKCGVCRIIILNKNTSRRFTSKGSWKRPQYKGGPKSSVRGWRPCQGYGLEPPPRQRGALISQETFMGELKNKLTTHWVDNCTGNSLLYIQKCACHSGCHGRIATVIVMATPWPLPQYKGEPRSPHSHTQVVRA